MTMSEDYVYKMGSSVAEKAKRIIGNYCRNAYNDANRKPDGTYRKKYVPYHVPEIARALINALNADDDEEIKRLFMIERLGTWTLIWWNAMLSVDKKTNLLYIDRHRQSREGNNKMSFVDAMLLNAEERYNGDKTMAAHFVLGVLEGMIISLNRKSYENTEYINSVLTRFGVEPPKFND